MKLKTKWKQLIKYIVIIIFIYISNTKESNLRSALRTFSKTDATLGQKTADDFMVGENPKDANSERTPKLININIDDGETDPVNMKKFQNEKDEINKRINNAEITFENEKRNLLNIISMQNAKIAQLALIADSNNALILKILNKKKV